jgi:RecJ-like exonuclease
MTSDIEDVGDDEGSGNPLVLDLDPECGMDDLEDDGRYLATVNGVVEYGVFVDLSNHVSGLVHESNLEANYEVGDQLIVELDQVREDGDVAFSPVRLEEYDVREVTCQPEITESAQLGGHVGEELHLEGEVVQVKQTGGPTIFHVRDEDGVVPCAAFEAAGVRAHPEIDLGDLVRVTGTVDEREGGLQIEADEIRTLEGDLAEDLRDRLDAAIEKQAEPPELEPLVDWPAFEKLYDDLRDVARLLRRTVLESRPIRIRHHADGDGMCAAVPVQLALERFIEASHEDPEAPHHLFKRLPSKAPFYEMEDATRDLNFALEDKARHGQKLPLLLMLDNGSTAEDVPAYRTLSHFDIPIVALDHHHPDPEAVEPLLEAHVNPYLYDEDYRITTGMMCVELARMIAPEIEDDLRHVPAVAGIADRSEADAMEQYLELAETAGYDETSLRDVSEALDYEAFWLRYDSGRELIYDALNVGTDNRDRHHELVSFLADRSREDVEHQLDAAMPHVEHERLENDAHLYRIDVEKYAHRFTYPAPGKTTGEIHDRKVKETGDPVITIGYGPDFAVLRSDGVRLDIPTMVSELKETIEGGGVSGGGHLVVGSIKFVKGRRKEVIDALVDMMADAEIDKEIGSTTPFHGD